MKNKLLLGLIIILSSTTFAETKKELKMKVSKLEKELSVFVNTDTNRNLIQAIKSYEDRVGIDLHFHSVEKTLTRQFAVLKTCLKQVKEDYPEFSPKNYSVEFSTMNYSGRTVKGSKSLTFYAQADVKSCYSIITKSL